MGRIGPRSRFDAVLRSFWRGYFVRKMPPCEGRLRHFGGALSGPVCRPSSVRKSPNAKDQEGVGRFLSHAIVRVVSTMPEPAQKRGRNEAGEKSGGDLRLWMPKPLPRVPPIVRLDFLRLSCLARPRVGLLRRTFRLVQQTLSVLLRWSRYVRLPLRGKAIRRSAPIFFEMNRPSDVRKSLRK